MVKKKTNKKRISRVLVVGGKEKKFTSKRAMRKFLEEK
jgi:hypothetical protein